MTSVRAFRCYLIATLTATAALPAAWAQTQPESPAERPSQPRVTAAHRVLHQDVGQWDAEVRFWSAPDAEPTVTKAVENAWLLGDGLWIVADFFGPLAGTNFHGHSLHGYDPTTKKYIGTWVDNMTPYLYTLEGTYNEKTRTLVMNSTGRDPGSGDVTTTRNLIHYQNDDRRTFEMHAAVEGQPGEWWKTMEIRYTRKKPAGSGQ